MKIFVPIMMTLALATSGCSNKHKRKSVEKKHAAKLLKGCAEGDGGSCYKLAMAAETVDLGAHVYKAQPSIKVSDVYETAIAHLESECSFSSAESCRVAGDFYQDMGHKRTTWEKDYYPSHAERINLQTGKHQTARWSLSKGYKKDREMAVEYYTKACHLSDARSCKALGSALSAAPVENLEGSQIAYGNAVEIYLSECEAGAKRILSCDKANHILVYNMKTPKSIQRGLELYKEGCKAGIAKDCNYVGGIHKNDRFGLENRSEAKKFFQRACDINKKSPCKAIQKLEQS